MPIQQAIWKVGTQPQALEMTTLPSEELLETMIQASPEILSREWMLIGRQEQTGFGGRIDLLAITPDGSLVLIELKRSKTPREIVAQALDYASWVERLTAEKIAQIYHRFSRGGDLNSAFKQRFGVELDEETLNASHQIIIAAAELDPASERIVQYLNDRDIAINVLFFQVFQNANEQFLSRSWLLDPAETQVNAVRTEKLAGVKEPWNGEFYVSFGEGARRRWDEARRHGFISAGGGRWYSKTLEVLSPGDRIWVKIPGEGYVGVGRVTSPAVAAKDFVIETDSGPKAPIEFLSTGPTIAANANDPERSEYFVGVEWLDAVSAKQAFKEIGLFGNQNSACQPQTPKWRHTVERLKTFFKNWDKAK